MLEFLRSYSSIEGGENVTQIVSPILHINGRERISHCRLVNVELAVVASDSIQLLTQ